nr:MAG TPA: hypothetical protein [Caudoviricetes sp.]
MKFFHQGNYTFSIKYIYIIPQTVRKVKQK